VETLPVGKFHGIGPATTAKMNSFGIFTGIDLRNQSLDFLQTHFGKAGAYYHSISRGIDERRVRANRVRKSVGAENTFSQDLTTYDAMHEVLQPLVDKVGQHCESCGARGRTVTLKVKYADFELISRSRSSSGAIASRDELEKEAVYLLKKLMPMPKAVRLLGVSVSGFADETEGNAPQMALAL
jgi:DNA polymerase-4